MSESQKIIDDKYIVIKKIGEGGFGDVYLTDKINDNTKKYVVKVLKKERASLKDKERFLHEIEILKKLSKDKNKYTPYLYEYGEGYIKEEKNTEENPIKQLYLVINYASKGSLFDYMNDKSFNGFEEKHAKIIFKKILEGIQFCHEANISHLDIKIQNILLDENFNPIITDFGLSEEIKDNNGAEILLEGMRGTQNYLCPQMWKKGTKWRGIEADIFSLGALLFKLVTNKWGFMTSTKKDNFYKNILFKNYNCYWNAVKSQINKDLSPEFKNLYIDMIIFKPDKRPRIKDILNGPWMKEINDLNNEEYQKLEYEVIKEFFKLEEKKEMKIDEEKKEKEVIKEVKNIDRNNNIKNDKKDINNNICEKKISTNEEKRKISTSMDDKEDSFLEINIL